jgi:hypothetical protein
VLYLNYDAIAQAYPGWSFQEVQGMTKRQRDYWMRMIRWKRERK